MTIREMVEKYLEEQDIRMTDVMNRCDEECARCMHQCKNFGCKTMQDTMTAGEIIEMSSEERRRYNLLVGG